MPNYFTLVFSFSVKGTIIYYAAISNNNNDLSHVKITCYFTCEDHVFGQKLTWYFIGVYIIISIIHFTDIVSSG